MTPLRIGVVASGSGSVARSVNRLLQVNAIPAYVAGVVGVGDKVEELLDWACMSGIPFTKMNGINRAISSRINDFFVEMELDEAGIDFILLSGFMKQLQGNILQNFPHRILNVHPADTRFFGGKGMYGKNVYDAVFASGTKTMYPTLHYVDEGIDTGEVIAFGNPIIISNNSGLIHTYESLKPEIQKEETRLVYEFFKRQTKRSYGLSS